MKDIMIDIETLGVPEELPTGRLVEVVQIAAVAFGSDGITRELNLFPAEGNGLATADTVTFWLKQILRKGHGEVHIPQWAYHRMDAESPEELSSMTTCLQQLTRFIGTTSPVIWSKGGFDLDILLDHYGANRLICPWRYYQRRDLRTMMKETGVSPGYAEVEHDALADAIAQAGYLTECRSHLTRKLAS